MADDSLKLVTKKNLTTEFFVGIFVVVGMLSFGYLAINLAGMSVSNAGYYPLSALFGDVSGLEVGSPVEMGGVEIGKVEAILLNGTQTVLKMNIREEVEIRDDDIFSVRSKGIIGDKYVKVKPGASDEIIPKGGTVTETVDVVELEGVIEQIVHSMTADKEEKPEETGN